MKTTCITLILALLTCIAQAQTKPRFTVVIDPGHGGQMVRGVSDGSQKGYGSSANNATSARYGLLEKNLTLEYSMAAKAAFAASPRAQALGIDVKLTREEDISLSALSRAARAVQASADVFVSIHFNASSSHTAEGTTAFI
ncbi:MAG: N-acetylmuramoyl-L-alanine amidase, partial [Verrucomicrobiota bacterium]